MDSSNFKPTTPLGDKLAAEIGGVTYNTMRRETYVLSGVVLPAWEQLPADTQDAWTSIGLSAAQHAVNMIPKGTVL